MKLYLLLISLLLSCYLTPVFAENFIYPHDPATVRDPMDALIDNDGKLLSEKKKEEEERKKLEAEKNKPPAEKKATDLALQGIIFTSSGGTVIIQNEIYYEGDMVGKIKILKITQNGITVSDGDQETFIKWEG